MQTWAVGVTGAVIVWYSWETMQLRRVAARQAELQLRPYVIFVADARHFSVENVGNAVALNVQIPDVVIHGPAKAIVRFPAQIPVLRPGQRQNIEAVVLVDGAEKSDFLLAHLNSDYATGSRTVTVAFSNAEGTEYLVPFEIGPKRVTAGPLESAARRAGVLI